MNKTKKAAALLALSLCVLGGVAVGQQSENGTPLGAFFRTRRQAAAPKAPAAGFMNYYTNDSNGHLYSQDSSNTIVDVQAGGGGGSGYYQTMQDEGSALAQQSTFNFTGDLVTCTNDSVHSRSVCNIVLPNAGPGAATYCGSAQYVNSITLDANGRVVGYVCGTPASSLPSHQVAYGTDSGTGVTGSTNFTYDSGTQTCTVPFLSATDVLTPEVDGTSAGLQLVGDGTSSSASLSLGATANPTATLYVGAAQLQQHWTADGAYQIPSGTAAPCAGCLSYSSSTLRYSNDGTTWSNFGSGGGGTIGGSIASTQIPVGTGTNTVGGSANLTADTSGNLTAAGSVTTPKIVSTGDEVINVSGLSAPAFTFSGYFGAGYNGLFFSGVPGTSNSYIYGGAGSIHLNGGSKRVAIDDALGWVPANDLTTPNGGSSARWTETWSRRYAGVSGGLAAAATITLDPAVSGEDISIQLSTTAITAVNGVAGYADEPLRVTIRQDIAGGRAISGWATGTNGFALASPYVPSPGSSAVDVLTFSWDSTMAVWREVSRVMAQPQVTKFGNSTYAGTSTDLPTVTWTALAATSPWSGTVYYFKDSIGQVHVRGEVTTGSASNAQIATLPIGFRPVTQFYEPSATNAGVQSTDVEPTGALAPTASVTTVILPEFTFMAAN